MLGASHATDNLMNLGIVYLVALFPLSLRWHNFAAWMHALAVGPFVAAMGTNRLQEGARAHSNTKSSSDCSQSISCRYGFSVTGRPDAGRLAQEPLPPAPVAGFFFLPGVNQQLANAGHVDRHVLRVVFGDVLREILVVFRGEPGTFPSTGAIFP